MGVALVRAESWRSVEASGESMRKLLATGEGTFLRVLSVLLFTVVLLRTAWLSDDAYITFRTIVNFADGYGLTWNAAERVQAYSHPLWLLLLSAAYFHTKEIYLTSILLSAGISLLAVCLLTFGISQAHPSAILGVTILTFSKAFMDYSTSGLENPLTHLTLVLFCWVFLCGEYGGKWVLLLSLIAGLGTLNRMDTLLLFLPGLAYALSRSRLPKGLLLAALGFLPFAVWEIFSLLYYGFPFPNTAYAKLCTGLEQWELVGQGFRYLLDSLNSDPLTLLVIATGLAVPCFAREWRASCVAAGAGLYLVYVVSIGGDFMSGRFLSAPLLAGTILLTRLPSGFRKAMRLPAFAAVLLLGLGSPHPSFLTSADYGNDYKLQVESVLKKGVSDERAFYYQVTGLLREDPDTPLPSPRQVWVAEAMRVREEGPRVVVRNSVGLFAFTAGPGVHVVDELGLGDPLLARLPPAWRPHWRIGHFFRVVPEGYVGTLTSGQNQLADRRLAEYYDKLSLITRGRLMDPKRLATIVEMNLGRYDSLIDTERYRYPGMLRKDLSEVLAHADAAPPQDRNADLVLPSTGIEISLGDLCHASILELTLDTHHDYQVVTVAEGRESSKQALWGIPGLKGEFVVRRAVVPVRAAKRGFDKLRILPGEGSGDSRLAWIRLLE